MDKVLLLDKYVSKKVLPFQENTFDKVISQSQIDHVDNLREFMNEVWRVSKKNAKVLISCHFYHTQTSFLPEHKQHMTYFHFADLEKTRKFKIVSFRTRGNIIGKLIPDIKLGPDKHIGLRYKMGTIIGELVKKLDVELNVIKNGR